MRLITLCLALILLLPSTLSSCATQRITRLETRADGTQFKDTYTATSVPLLGSKTSGVFNYEKTGLNNVKAGHTAESDSTATVELLTQVLNLVQTAFKAYSP
jgi:hypothetical protein